VPLSGIAAKVVTKAYHIYALPSGGNRLRVAADWVLNLVSRPVTAQLGLVSPRAARLSAEWSGAASAAWNSLSVVAPANGAVAPTTTEERRRERDNLKRGHETGMRKPPRYLPRREPRN
jgi:hypothetical protein